jgi:folate-binding protein YgfZ
VSRSAFEQLALGAIQSSFEGWVVVDVSGKDRERFLISQLTSDVAGLEVGRSQLSALLDRSGRLQAFFFLAKHTDRMVLLVPTGAVEALADQLEANIIADDVRLSRRETGSLRLALGPEAVRFAAALPDDVVFPIEALGGRGFVTWGNVQLPFHDVDAEELEALRVVSGLPKWGIEVVGGELINQTTLVDTAVSFTKGCYLGQETVAKVASHRGAAYHPVLLTIDGNGVDTRSLVNQQFAIGERKNAGKALSAAVWNGRQVLQASMYRDFRVDGLAVECRFESGALHAEVSELPLTHCPPPEEQAEALFLAAVELFTIDQEQEAVELLERAIAVCPGHADSYETMGVILGRHGRYEEAIDLMTRLLEVEPDSVMAHTNMSLYHNQLGRIEEAEREARSAAAKQAAQRRREEERLAAEKQVRDDLATDLQRREDMFNQVLELDPGDALANFGMGEVLVASRRFDEAVPHLEKAIEVDESYSAAFLALGRAWEGMEQPARARTVYQTGVEVAARRGDLSTANAMQARIGELAEDAMG